MKRHWFVPQLRAGFKVKYPQYCIICGEHILSSIHFTTNEFKEAEEKNVTQ